MIVENIIPRNMDINSVCALVDNHIPQDDIVRIMFIIQLYFIKISHRGWKLLSALCFPFKIQSMEITPKLCRGEQLFKYTTHHLDPIYMPTKYYYNISTNIKVTE